MAKSSNQQSASTTKDRSRHGAVQAGMSFFHRDCHGCKAHCYDDTHIFIPITSGVPPLPSKKDKSGGANPNNSGAPDHLSDSAHSNNKKNN
ncbi:hypothetical protein H4R35_003197, partial [Dimargaris xerosporica]